MPAGRLRLYAKGRKQKASRRPMRSISKLRKDVTSLKNQVERKSVDHVLHWTALPSTLSVQDFNDTISQGTANNQRVGNKITAKSLQIKAQFKIGNSSITANDSYNQVRMIIIRYETDDPSSTPLIDDILEHTDTNSPEELMCSMYKRDSNYRFNVLYDKVHNLYWGNNSGGSGGGPRLKIVNFKHNCKDRSIRFNSSGNPTTKYTALFISDSGVSTHPELCYNTRFYFTDK